MKTAIKPSLQLKSIPESKSNYPLRREEKSFIDFKLHQRLFVILISLSTFLIFPELPRELENICENYNSRKLCNVW